MTSFRNVGADITYPSLSLYYEAKIIRRKNILVEYCEKQYGNTLTAREIKMMIKMEILQKKNLQRREGWKNERKNILLRILNQEQEKH